MEAVIPAVIAIFFALLLAALVVALIASPDFRTAVLGGPSAPMMSQLRAG